MQTRLHDHRPHRPSSIVAAAAVTAAVLTTAGCTTPRFEGRAESEQTVSDCERAYYAAVDAETSLTGPFVLQSLAAADAATQWLDVAVDCPSRFGEGVTNAVRLTSRYATAGIGADDGTNDTDDAAAIATADIWPSLTAARDAADPSASSASASDDTTGTAAAIPASALAAMALAEDRAGFILQIMAARGDGDVTLAMSDAHHTAGERLFSLSGLAIDDDPRLKTYDASALLDHPSTLVDPATGLSAPALAVVEMNCAREEIAAVDPSGDDADSGTADTAGTATDGTATDDTATDDTATGASDADGTATDDSGATASSSADAARTTRRALAELIASRLRLAFDHGYPMFDEALFA